MAMGLESALGARSWVAEFMPMAAMWLVEQLTGGRTVCRSCGARVTPRQIVDMVEQGCAQCGAQKLDLQDARVWRAVLLVLAPVVLLAVLVMAAPIGCDYDVFRRAAQAWASGTSQLYDAAAPGFYYAPWSVPLFVVLSWLPDWLASSLVNAASLAALVVAVRLLIGRAPWWAILIAISNIWTANLIGATQWDALVVAAVAVAYYAVQRRSAWLLGLAVAFIGTKPTNVWLALVIVVLGAIRARWSWREWITMAVVPAECLILSFLVAGLDWPMRYVQFLRESPPNAGYNVAFWGPTNTVQGLAEISAVAASMWALALHIKRVGFDGVAVALALVVNLMVSPYVTIYHYVATVPALVWLGRRDSLWLVWTYAASIAWLLLRDPWLPVFPLVVAVAALWVEIQDIRLAGPVGAPA